MTDIEEKLARSLTADSIQLIPYLPHLLQDLWELGAIPADIESLTSTHIEISTRTRVLDLACGKGAVSVTLARTFGCKVKGVDLLPEFIECARRKAKENGVERLCQFEVEDINRSIQRERGYDAVILGAVGDVLGDPTETVAGLKRTVRPLGYIFIDDGYPKDDAPHQTYPSREDWLTAFREAGVRVVDAKVADEGEVRRVNRRNQTAIVERANELKVAHPELRDLFERYVRSQQAECDELEGEIIGVTWLLQV